MEWIPVPLILHEVLNADAMLVSGTDALMGLSVKLENCSVPCKRVSFDCWYKFCQFCDCLKKKMNCVDVWVFIGMKSGGISLISSYMLQYILDNSVVFACKTIHS